MTVGIPVPRRVQPSDRRERRRECAELGDLVLSADLTRKLDRTIAEHRNALAKHGLGPRSRLLFVGPPGCGIDEFDTIGKRRDDDHEIGELHSLKER